MSYDEHNSTSDSSSATTRPAVRRTSTPGASGEFNAGIRLERGQASIGQVQRVNSSGILHRNDQGVLLSRNSSFESHQATNRNDVEDSLAKDSGDKCDGPTAGDKSGSVLLPSLSPQPLLLSLREELQSPSAAQDATNTEAADLPSSPVRSPRVPQELPNVSDYFSASNYLVLRPEADLESTRDEQNLATSDRLDESESDNESDLSAVDPYDSYRTSSNAAQPKSNSQSSKLSPSSDESFSPVASRTASFAATGSIQQQSPHDHRSHGLARNGLWQTLNPLDLNYRRPVSEGSPMLQRSPSPVRAASVEVLLAEQTLVGNGSSASSAEYDRAGSPSPYEEQRDQPNQRNLLLSQNLAYYRPASEDQLDTSITTSLAESEVATNSLGPPKASSSLRESRGTLSTVDSLMESVSSASRSDGSMPANGDLYGEDPPGLDDAETFRPSTGQTVSTIVSSDGQQTYPDVFPDISYEQSFMPPESTAKGSGALQTSLLQPVVETEENCDPKQMTDIHKSTPVYASHESELAVQSLELVHSSADHDMSLKETDVQSLKQDHKSLEIDLAKQDKKEIACRSRSPLRPIVQQMERRSRSQSPRPAQVITKAWETPAATKQYIDDAPSKTAISKRVENFQIPPERLSAMQPEIAAMYKQSKKPPDKLSLKESSAQIDALLNENWGLKMKIMFMDKHFEHDREKADLIAENVRLQTNGYNFVQQVKSRDRTIKSLEKQLADAECRHATEQSSSSAPGGRSTEETSKLVISEDNIRREEEYGLRNLELKVALDVANEKLGSAEDHIAMLKQEIAHTSQWSEDDYSATLRENEELRQSLALAEEEIAQYEHELEAHLRDLNEITISKDSEVVEVRKKLGELNGLLQSYENELNESDDLRQQAIDEIRMVHETERLEYEMYIADRHEEIDNLRQVMKSYNQESFELRLTEAVRPHKEALREVKEQCSSLLEELTSCRAQWTQERESFEEKLEDSLLRETSLNDNVETLQAQLKLKSESLKELHQEFTALLSRIADMEDQLQAAAASSDSADSIAALNSRIYDLAKEVSTLECSSKDYRSKWEEAKTANFALSIEMQNRQEQEGRLRQDLDDRMREISSLKSDAEEFQNHMEQLDRRCHQYEDDIAGLHQEIDEIHRANDLQTDRAAVSLHEKVSELELCQGELQAVRKERQIFAQDLETIEASLTQRGVAIAGGLDERLRSHIDSLEEQKERQRTLAESARQAQNDSAFEVRKHRSAMEQNELELRQLRKQLADAVTTRSQVETKLRLEGQANIDLKRALAENQREINRGRATTARALDNSNALLANLMTKIHAILGSDSFLGTPSSERIPDLEHFEDFKERLQAGVDLLWQRSMSKTGEQRSSEADLRKRLAEAEARLQSRVQRHERSKSKLDELRAENDSLRQQLKSGTGQKSDLVKQNTTDVEVASPTSKQTSAPDMQARDEYWTLHERIKALTRDVKYQKELREQDDQAAKTRLSESKLENEDLRRQLDRQFSGSRTLSIERSESRTGIRRIGDEADMPESVTR